MNALDHAVVKAFRALPDDEILRIAKQYLGGGGAPQSLQAIPKAPRVRKAAVAAAKPGLKKAAARPAKAPATKPAKGGGGDKRTPEAMASQMQDILDAVTANHGLGAEQLAKELKLPSKALALPMKKLIADGKVRTEGQKRATKYYPV